MREEFHRWLFEVCPLVIASPNKKDTVLEKDENDKTVIVKDEFGEPVPRRDSNKKLFWTSQVTPSQNWPKFASMCIHSLTVKFMLTQQYQ